ncbi:alpha/beta-hydrolase [Paxillus ammoniavirescens]|nr:alpha/beta-hydrolase [Paxillus ammoniavirescens]
MVATNRDTASLRTSTIPHTQTLLKWESVHPRQLLPILPHPDLQKIETPALPSPSRSPVFHTTLNGTYLRSTHVILAAFPRLVPDIPLPQIPQYTTSGSAAERLEQLEALTREVIQKQQTFTEGKLGGGHSEKALWNCLNRYVRMGGVETRRAATGNRGVTLFLAHANGFPKEIWETMLRSLLDSPAGYMIDEVWAWEAVQHGDSALVNASNLSGIFDWSDNSRDIANFLLNYLPEEVKTEALPIRLERVLESSSRARKEHGYRTRKIAVVGHSFGGCTSLRVALDFPTLFSSLILVDPVLLQPPGYTLLPGFLRNKVLGAYSRRERWASREEALRLFKKSPFFSRWNPGVLQLYVDHGLADDSSGGVKLKMSGLHEGLTFADQTMACETWELLDRLDEAISLRWVVPEDGVAGGEATRATVWRRPTNSSNVVFHFSGHLIVQEAPVELAQDISDFLLRRYGSSTRTHL